MFQKKCSVILDHAEPLLETGKIYTVQHCGKTKTIKKNKKNGTNLDPSHVCVV